MQIESNRRAKLSGNSTAKYWLDNDVDEGIDEMPNPNHHPRSYMKAPLLWAFYYLKNGFSFENAI